MKHKNGATAVFIFVGVFMLSSMVFAASALQEERQLIKDERKDAREDAMEVRKEVKEQVKEKRCEGIENRIRTRIGRYENKQEEHKRIFDKLVSRVQVLADKFADSGLDVSQLKADLKTFEAMIADLQEEHDTFIAGLKETQTQACGESEGEYRKQLGEARRMIPEVRARLIEVRDYYQTVIRVDILDLREQISAIDDENQDEVAESDQSDGQE